MSLSVGIPMKDSPCFSESVTLDNNEYRLRFTWNTRGAFWAMDISDANDNLLLAGVRLVISFPLNTQHPQMGLPTGVFLVVDKNPKTATVEPGRSDFVGGRNLTLVYWSRA